MKQTLSKDDIKRSKERIIATGEVYTDEKLVNDILDMVKPEDWSNPDITMLEPSCGDGNFVVVMIGRFMDGLEAVIPDRTKRFQHIVEKQVHAIDIMPDNVIATRNRISETFGIDIELCDHNIIQADTLAYDCQFGKEVTDELGMTYKTKKDLSVHSDDIPKEKNSAPRKSSDTSKMKKEDLSFFD